MERLGAQPETRAGVRPPVRPTLLPRTPLGWSRLMAGRVLLRSALVRARPGSRAAMGGFYLGAAAVALGLLSAGSGIVMLAGAGKLSATADTVLRNAHGWSAVLLCAAAAGHLLCASVAAVQSRGSGLNWLAGTVLAGLVFLQIRIGHSGRPFLGLHASVIPNVGLVFGLVHLRLAGRDANRMRMSAQSNEPSAADPQAVYSVLGSVQVENTGRTTELRRVSHLPLRLLVLSLLLVAVVLTLSLAVDPSGIVGALAQIPK